MASFKYKRQTGTDVSDDQDRLARKRRVMLDSILTSPEKEVY